MRLRAYLIGVALAGCALFTAFTGDYTSRTTLHLTVFALTYVVYATLAVVLTNVGRNLRMKGWTFFLGGIGLLYIYLPSLDLVVAWFYHPAGHDDRIWFEVIQNIYFYSPLLVSGMCVYRGICFWADDALQKPNQALQPTPMLVTPRADARVAPSTGVADL